MTRAETNAIRRQTLIGLSEQLPGSQIIDGRRLKSSKCTLLAAASKDYVDANGLHNWYGIYEEELEELKEESSPHLLFTTGSVNDFLLIPYDDFERKVKPYLHPTSVKSYFLLVQRINDRWVFPKKYIPADNREAVQDEGIDLTEYHNATKNIGITYTKFVQKIVNQKTEPQELLKDMDDMVRFVAEKEPSFFAKSIEEKLVIIRYHQLANSA